MPRHDSISLGELNDSQFYILAALVQPRHGYAVMQLLLEVPNQMVHIGPASALLISGLLKWGSMNKTPEANTSKIGCARKRAIACSK